MIRQLKKNHANLAGGQAMLVVVVFFLFISSSVMFSITRPLLSELRAASRHVFSEESFYRAEGGLEDIISRVKKGYTVAAAGDILLGESIAGFTVEDETPDSKIIVVSATSTTNLVRRLSTNTVRGVGASFFYGTQSGIGGIFLENTSRVLGNLYSNGPVEATNNNLIAGDVVSAGAGGLVNGIHATGTVHAHTIQNAEIDGDAYYQTLTSSTVWGALYPGSEDQPEVPLPISDADISGLEQAAADGGVISSPCPYKINSDTTLGPVKITCDVEISGSPTVTFAGPVWVVGNIDVQNNAQLQIESSLGETGIAVIADNPADSLNSGKIILRNSTSYSGSGAEGSYILMLSQNSSAENGEDVKAIQLLNSASGDVILYAAHGEIEIKNNVTLKEVTAYLVNLENSATVIYETGLENSLFTSGPSGGWKAGGWSEI